MKSSEKKCAYCNQTKLNELFPTDSKTGLPRGRKCRECQKSYHKAYREKNKDKIKANRNTLESKERHKGYLRSYMEDPEYRQKVRERANENQRKPEQRKKQYEWRNKKYATDVAFHMKHNMRARLHKAIKRAKTQKTSRYKDLIGCDNQHLMKYLESLWLPGMTWENYGYGKDRWTVDHKLPCASFDLTDPEQQRKCFHYTNLQPMWWLDNLAKRDKVPESKL